MKVAKKTFAVIYLVPVFLASQPMSSSADSIIWGSLGEGAAVSLCKTSPIEAAPYVRLNYLTKNSKLHLASELAGPLMYSDNCENHMYVKSSFLLGKVFTKGDSAALLSTGPAFALTMECLSSGGDTMFCDDRLSLGISGRATLAYLDFIGGETTLGGDYFPRENLFMVSLLAGFALGADLNP